MKKILFVHLLNDLSGSPRVLRQVMDALGDKGYKIYLSTSKDTQGFLENNPKVSKAYYFPYQWSPSRLTTLIRFSWAQLHIFKAVFKFRKEVDVVYINTVLPIGAAIAAIVMRKKIIYHLHESEVSPKALNAVLFFVMHRYANHIIFVSEYLRAKVRCKQASTIIYNSLDEGIALKAKENDLEAKPTAFTVLMVCSWKTYKGVYQFIRLSEMLPDLQFEMVLNADENQVRQDLNARTLPKNLSLSFKVKDVSAFYLKSHVIVNLSFPDQWVETFGLTLLEGMAFGLPAIGPPAGGVKEVITDHVNGYWIDPYDINSICRMLTLLKNDHALYKSIALEAFKTPSKFTMSAQAERIVKVMDGF